MRGLGRKCRPRYRNRGRFPCSENRVRPRSREKESRTSRHAGRTCTHLHHEQEPCVPDGCAAGGGLREDLHRKGHRSAPRPARAPGRARLPAGKRRARRLEAFPAGEIHRAGHQDRRRDRTARHRAQGAVEEHRHEHARGMAVLPRGRGLRRVPAGADRREHPRSPEGRQQARAAGQGPWTKGPSTTPRPCSRTL